MYNATTVATITSRTLTGVIGADVVTYSGGTATFADKNVGAGKVVTATGLALTGADAGNYTVNTTALTNANITPATIADVTGITVNNKVYDTTTAAALNTVTAGFTGLLAGDVLTVATATGAFTDKNAANGKTVNISGITLGGVDAGNYTLTTNTATATANITPAAITNVTGIAANNKVYDATPLATLSTVAAGFTGLLAGDALTVATATGAFTDKNAANGKTVNISGITLGGADAGNYALTTNTATALANITPAVLTVSFTGVNKIYDATAAATVITGDNRLGGDVLTINRSASFADANAGIAKPVSVTGVVLTGPDASNYTVTTTGTATADIGARGVTVTANNANKVYGNADPTLTFIVGGAGLAGADTLASVFSGALARAPGENVAGGPYAINRGALASNSNYSITAFTPGQLTIVPRALTITADNKNGNVGQPLPPFSASYSGFAFNETPANLAGALTFATPATNTSPPGAYVITPSGLSSGNYSITYGNGSLTLQTGASAISGDVLSSINAGSQQLPPPFLSGPFEGGPTALSTGLLVAMQPSNILGDAATGGAKPDAGVPLRPLLTGAVKQLVDIVNGGLKVPDNVEALTVGTVTR